MARKRLRNFKEECVEVAIRNLVKQKVILHHRGNDGDRLGKAGYINAKNRGEIENMGAQFVIALHGGLFMPIDVHYLASRTKSTVDDWEAAIRNMIRQKVSHVRDFYQGIYHFTKRAQLLDIDEDDYNSQLSVGIISKKLLHEKYIEGYKEALPNGELDGVGADFVYQLSSGLWFLFQVKPGNNTASKRTCVTRKHHKKHPLINSVIFVRWKNKQHLRTIEFMVKKAIREQAADTYKSYRED